MAANFRPYFAPPSLRVDTRWNVEPFSNAVQQYVNRERMSAIGQAEDPLQAARDLGELGIAANLIQQDQRWEQIDETQRQNAANNKTNQARLGISQAQLKLQQEQAARAAALMPYQIQALKNSTDLQSAYLAREEAAGRIGLKPGTPEFSTFVLTGKLPGSDQSKNGMQYYDQRTGRWYLVQPTASGAPNYYPIQPPGSPQPGAAPAGPVPGVRGPDVSTGDIMRQYQATPSAPTAPPAAPPAMPSGFMPKGVTTRDTGTDIVTLDGAGNIIMRMPKNIIGREVQEAIGKDKGAAIVKMPVVESEVKRIFGYIDAILKSPALGRMTSPATSYLPNVSSEARAFQQRVEQLKGKAFVTAFDKLRGAGAITETEGAAAAQALARLQQISVGSAEFKIALQDFKNEVEALRQIVRQKAGGTTGNFKRLKFNPNTGALEPQ